MPLFKGIDQPVRDFLGDLTQAASAGICMVTDPRGLPIGDSNKRLAWVVLPTSATTFVLLQVDLETRNIQQLAAPPAAAGGAYTCAIMAALYDATGGAASNAPTVYVLVSLTQAPFAQWMAYDVQTDAWAILTPPACGPAGATPLATSVALAHPCAVLGDFQALDPNIDEDFIYATGDLGQWGAAGPSRIAQYSKAGDAWAYLIPVGARGAAPGAGSKMVWLPTYPNYLIHTRGGASALWEVYGFAGNAWAAAFTPAPATLLNEGSELATLHLAPGWIAVRPAGLVNQILIIAAGGLVQAAPEGHYLPLCEIDASALPAAHAQNALIAWWISGNYYVGAIPYGRSIIRRIQLPLPV